jgi:hypothetical protein
MPLERRKATSRDVFLLGVLVLEKFNNSKAKAKSDEQPFVISCRMRSPKS